MEGKSDAAETFARNPRCPFKEIHHGVVITIELRAHAIRLYFDRRFRVELREEVVDSAECIRFAAGTC